MLKPLTSLRIFAALAVFLSHLDLLKNFKGTQWVYNNIFYEGYVGVTFFFILSGFILTYNYHDKFATLEIININKFLKARLSRIYPVYLLTFCISLPLSLKALLNEPWNVILKGIINIIMLQSFVPKADFYFSFNAPSWSISDEMFFYALLPIIIYLYTKYFTSFNKLSLLYFTVGIWVAATLIVGIMRNNPHYHWLFYINPIFRLIDFLIGISLCLLFIKLRNRQFRNTVFSIMEFSAVLLLVIAVFLHPYIHQTLRLWGYYQPFMAIVIFIFAFQKGFLSKLISNKTLIVLGEASFSFYMLHRLVIDYCRHIHFIVANPTLFSFTTLCISLIASIIMYKHFEIPLRNRIRNTGLTKLQAKEAF